ncbi:MAG: cytochrome c peroxidase [Saprospiraceae bacterium]|nr:cytochrome c peroxidase [Saprospiraceae bacterium]
MKNLFTKISLGFALALGVLACHDLPTKEPMPGDLDHIPYDPQPYAIMKPSSFPNIPVPADNPMTLDAVQLGRRLFYDPLLSADSTQSCSSCHLPQGNFTDNKAVSIGIDGISGRRSSMALLNIAYATNGLFWDGRSASLEEQALRPVEDPIEMHNTWTQVIEKLRVHPTYPALFRKAFGINDRDQISEKLAARAIAQFERILISSGTSKFDQFKEGNIDVFDEEELDGYLMYFEEAWQYGLNLPDAQCFHCHGGITLTGNNYFNNGLDSVASLDDFKDLGRFEVTGNHSDKGKFRTPTLRNIALSGPYMHDGRFQTLEEVVENYSKKGFGVSNEDPNLPLMGLNAPNNTLSADHKKSLVKFLHTLTDTVFIKNPDIQNPFQ